MVSWIAENAENQLNLMGGYINTLVSRRIHGFLKKLIAPDSHPYPNNKADYLS